MSTIAADAASPPPAVTLADGAVWPALGLGTWRMGESPRSRAAEVAAVRAALVAGYRLIDTAEMYGDGGAETVVGRALSDAIASGEVRREDLVVVSKVYPHHATAAGVRAACRRSLKRLGLERLDAYLLHWRGQVPLAETVRGFEALREEGLVARWGVSNFDVDDLAELIALAPRPPVLLNQIWYSLGTRGPAWDLLPWQQREGIVTMAYSPIGQGALLREPGLVRVAARLGATPAQVALAWLLRQPGVIAIPKSASPERQHENLASARVRLGADDLADLDAAFPPPTGKQPLAMT